MVQIHLQCHHTQLRWDPSHPVIEYWCWNCDWTWPRAAPNNQDLQSTTKYHIGLAADTAFHWPVEKYAHR